MHNSSFMHSYVITQSSQLPPSGEFYWQPHAADETSEATEVKVTQLVYGRAETDSCLPVLLITCKCLFKWDHKPGIFEWSDDGQLFFFFKISKILQLIYLLYYFDKNFVYSTF